jgi:hypothetical protein
MSPIGMHHAPLADVLSVAITVTMTLGATICGVLGDPSITPT